MRFPTRDLRAVLLRAPQVIARPDRTLGDEALNAIVVTLEDGGSIRSAQLACAAVRERGLSFAYWIEVARAPALAEAHPEWTASLPSDGEWRRAFPDVPAARDGELAKAHPWVPIASEEAFAAQLARVRTLLAGKPEPDAIFLNDLQGGPSACGCGNVQCRSIEGDVAEGGGTPIGPDAAVRFMASVQQLAPRARIIPVWTSECERGDGACNGVLCTDVREDACVRKFRQSWQPVRARSSEIALLLTYRAFGRDEVRYGIEKAAWVRTALVEAPRIGAGSANAPVAAPLIAVLQGWEVKSDEIAAQIARAGEARVGGWVVALTPIDASYEPRLFRAAAGAVPRPRATP